MRTTTTLLTACLALAACAKRTPAELTIHDKVEGQTRRMPAEWEPQAAVWLQWPQPWEGAGVETAFTGIVEAISDHEDVHVLVHDARTRRAAEAALVDIPAARLTLHDVPTGSSWMRDNGPRYVQVDDQWVVQDWGFDGWGQRWGAGAWIDRDDAVPPVVAEHLGLPIETVTMVHERGDLEVNGRDTALVNWSVVSHRNPGHSRAALTAAFEEALGIDSVIWAEGFDPLDGTRGHIDGMARFISEDTILVGDDGGQLMDDVAEQIATQRPDLTVQRLVSRDASIFLNFLIGNGFVLVATSGHAEEDAEAERVLEEAFPGRDIRFVDVSALWDNGGGIHCVTNDQPRLD